MAGIYPSGLVPETDECLSEVWRLGERYFQGGVAKGEAVPPHGWQAFKGDLYLIIEGTVPNRLPGTR